MVNVTRLPACIRPIPKHRNRIAGHLGNFCRDRQPCSFMLKRNFAHYITPLQRKPPIAPSSSKQRSCRLSKLSAWRQQREKIPLYRFSAAFLSLGRSMHLHACLKPSFGIPEDLAARDIRKRADLPHLRRSACFFKVHRGPLRVRRVQSQRPALRSSCPGSEGQHESGFFRPSDPAGIGFGEIAALRRIYFARLSKASSPTKVHIPSAPLCP